MGYIPPQPPNWRCDPGLVSIYEYKRKFALLPVKCDDGTKVWFKFYYKKYEIWSHGRFGVKGSLNFDENDYLHTDFIGCLTEADYIVCRLVEGF